MTPAARIEQLARQAVAAVPTDHGHPRACRHLPAAGIGVLCGMHPDRIECHACFRRHWSGHNPELEHTCDVCDAVTETIVGYVAPWVARFRRPHRGADTLIRVFVGALGLCPPYHRQTTGVAA